jgi:hypothetical protein
VKAVIRNRIYLEVTPGQQADIDEKLTYTLPPRRPGDPPLYEKDLSQCL